jgi:hypothetical protein
MQVNPIFASNVVSYLSWSRVKNKQSVNKYRAGLLSDTGALLSSAMGTELRFSDSSTLTPAASKYGRQWSLELPRVFTERIDPATKSVVKRDQDAVAPASCWEDRQFKDSYPELRFWVDEIQVGQSTVVGQSEWARCYLLPRAEIIENQQFAMREGFDELKVELNSLVALRKNFH